MKFLLPTSFRSTRPTTLIRFYSTSQSQIKAAPLSPLFDNFKKDIDPPKLPINHYFSSDIMKGSHRKINHLTRMISKMSLSEAKLQMDFCLKKPAQYVSQLIESTQKELREIYKLDPTRYRIRVAIVGKFKPLKRPNFHARGRFGIKTRPYSRVKIQVEEFNPNPTKREKEIETMIKIVKKQKLYRFRDTDAIQKPNAPWDKRPWKYLSSPKWSSTIRQSKQDLLL